MRFPKNVREFLTPPEQPDPSESIRAANIHYLALALMCGKLIGFASASRELGFVPEILVSLIVMLGGCALCIMFVRRRKLTLAGWGLASLLWLSTTLTVVRYGSLFDTGYGTYVCIVAAAGLLAGTRGAITAAFASIGVGAWFAIQFGDADLKPPSAMTTLANWSLLFAVMVGLIAIVNRGIAVAVRRMEGSAERLRVLTEGTRDLVSEFSLDGRLTYASPNHLEVLGHRPDELIGRNVLERAHPDDQRALAEIGQGTTTQREQVPLRYRHADGSWRHLETDILGFRSSEGTPMMMAVSRDVTARHELESQLQSSQRLESVGRLAGGVAHDFNNLLTVIRGYAEILQLRSPGEEIDEIDRAADRATKLVRQLLAFSRRQPLAPEVFDLNEVIAGVEAMLLRLITEDIVLTMSLCDDDTLLLADPAQLEQVIVNLVVNARDAMPDGGQLHIETRISPAKARAGEEVTMRVSDTGEGMEEATIAHIFEPFFTTKDEGDGTGLGLSTVHGIVIQSGGSVEVDSKPGAGTTFEVRLPRCQESKASAAAPLQRSVSNSLAGVRVLLVEDNKALCRLISRTLQAEGFQVFEASNGVDALALARQIDFDVLVTDVVMPQMGGPELREHLRTEHADLRVVFMSGYSDIEPGAQFTIAQDEVILQKPFSPADLVLRVSELVRGHEHDNENDRVEVTFSEHLAVD